MQCCVPFCLTTPETVSESARITFHKFPSEDCLRDAWLRAIGKQDSHLPDSAVVCSQHFLNDDLCTTESGSRQIRPGAIPSMVQVCMICLDTRSKLLLMSKYNLDEAYQHLVGQPLCDQGNLKGTLCIQCAQRLVNFNKFRDKSLRARALMMELVEKHELVTRQHTKMINRTKHQLKSNMVLTSLGPDHCDLHILEHPSEDKQTESEETRLKVMVKIEGNDDSMSVHDDMEMKNEDDNDVYNFVQDPLKYEITLYQCTHCLEEFVHEHAYMQHMNMHLQNGAGDGECDASQECKPHTAVSSSHSSLITENKQADPSPCARAATTLAVPLSTTEHIEPVTNEENVTVSKNVYICDFCKKMYEQRMLFVKHIQGHTLVNRFTCDTCTYKSKYKGNLVRHMGTHTSEKPHCCKLCESKFVSSTHLVRHMRIHSGEKPYCCKLCQTKFISNSHLVRHMRTHTGEKPYSCKLCNYKFSQNCHLLVHMRTHTGEKPYSCKLCNYKFSQNCHLAVHLRTHTGEKPYSCKLCNYKFSQNCHLVVHMKIHTGEKPYSCKLCNYKFSQNCHLVVHMRTHTGEKPYSCKLCNYKFSQNCHLVVHMRTHTGEKPYSCKLCNCKFSQNCHLVVHMRTHTGEKPYSCKLCNYKFSQNCHLVVHMRTHTGEKPYSCKTHTGEKPYSCKLCNYKCKQNSHLVRHMRTHTGEKPYSCKLCYYKYSRNSP
ncbi:zinc finger protein 2 homolog isoform X2 [Maniola jurtina]|uniref:zinc finger protein 2 homolog isoform X2 n=1 Tax=Maniola jurtina TaxID=191418 RepID=UPI001E68C138|nr:zinc finger protein 2 homolog isoform X2 [Maniola jurtina]